MRILITGSVAIDYLMTFPGFFKDHILLDKLANISLSFLVDSLEQRFGGIAPNIAYAMTLLGEKPMFWASVGDDFRSYRNFLNDAGVDTSGATEISGVKTASFFVNTDQEGNQIASFFPGAMSYAKELTLRELDFKPDLVVISPNDPGAMNLYVEECKLLGFDYIFDPSQQIVRLTKDELLSGIEGARGMFGNEYEVALIENLTGWSAQDIARREGAPDGFFFVVTQGQDGSAIYTESGTKVIPSVQPRALVCPTGVGDAFRGGFLTGLARGLALDTCGKLGSLVASYCLENLGSLGYSFTPDEFKVRFEKEFGSQFL